MLLRLLKSSEEKNSKNPERSVKKILNTHTIIVFGEMDSDGNIFILFTQKNVQFTKLNANYFEIFCIFSK